MWKALLELVFVPHCASCDARSCSGLCSVCAESLYPLGTACPRCAEPLEGPVALECIRCRRAPPPFAAARAAYRYGGELAVALRKLKYERRPDLARALAPYVSPALAEAAAAADLAMPVPLHWRRLSQRGFNQAATLLAHAGRGLGIPLDTLSLRRIRATAPQSGLGMREREGNVAAAFAVVPGRRARVAHKRILLFDDVMTTGATMAAAARALTAAGAEAIIAFAAARAEP
jgi:ComF family protein